MRYEFEIKGAFDAADRKSAFREMMKVISEEVATQQRPEYTSSVGEDDPRGITVGGSDQQGSSHTIVLRPMNRRGETPGRRWLDSHPIEEDRRCLVRRDEDRARFMEILSAAAERADARSKTT